MSEILKNRIKIIDEIIKSADIDYNDLIDKEIDFNNHETKRIINSFLFSFTKLQDNIGAKLFKEVLYELREIETKHYPMLDILHKLERLNMIDNIEEWDMIREIRNELTHEYTLNYQSRIENLKRTFWAYNELKKIYFNIKNYLQNKQIV